MNNIQKKAKELAEIMLAFANNTVVQRYTAAYSWLDQSFDEEPFWADYTWRIKPTLTTDDLKKGQIAVLVKNINDPNNRIGYRVIKTSHGCYCINGVHAGERVSCKYEVELLDNA